MMKSAIPAMFLLAASLPSEARGAFTIAIDGNDFGITSVFNEVAEFEIQIVVDAPLTVGTTYANPTLISVDYLVRGVLSQPTPSGFPGFRLVRSISGADFYNLSPEATLNFAISSTADLSDGLSISELEGTGTVFEFNARELDQNPGRYHPPSFMLADDGTGRLANSNNQSIFPNPDSGLLVNVQVAQEYDVTLDFDTDLTIAAIPEPSTALFSACALGLGLLRRRRVG